MLYFHGKGIKQDLERAFSLFITAAKSGDKDANNNAGNCLEQGIGTELRPSLALYYYTKGAEQDSIQAMYSLGFLLIRSSVKTLEDLSHAKEIQSTHGYKSKNSNFDNLKDKFSAPSTIGKIPLGLGSHRGPDGSGIKKDPNGFRNSAAIKVTNFNNGNFDKYENENENGTQGGGKGTQHLSNNSSNKQLPRYSTQYASTSLEASERVNDLSLSLPYERKSYKTNTLAKNNKNMDLGSGSGMDLGSYKDPSISQQMKAEEQVKEGVRWLRAAAERGVLDARYQLGLVYEQVRQKRAEEDRIE